MSRIYKHKHKSQRYQIMERCPIRNYKRAWFNRWWQPKWIDGIVYTGSGLVFVRSLKDFNKNFVELKRDQSL